ncbi:MAG: Tetratricopeptide repeat protein [Verrucomicrobiota bacterium]|nr:Tetratricopeptide repeat protein [Verrucomicrobiota bacterium]
MKNTLLTLLAFAAALGAQAQTPVEQAAAALKAGDLAAAESRLTPLTTGDQPDPAALQQLSLVRLRQNKAADAVALAEQAVKLAPGQAGPHATLGQALAQRIGEVGFMQQAMMAGRMRKAFEKAVELEPNHLGGLIGLSRYYINAPEIAGGSPVKAKEFALRVRGLEPALGETDLGNIAERQEDFATALTHYEALAVLRPDHGSPHYLCGRMLAQLGRKDEARTRFETALRNDPKLEAAQKALAELGSPAS